MTNKIFAALLIFTALLGLGQARKIRFIKKILLLN